MTIQYSNITKYHDIVTPQFVGQYYNKSQIKCKCEVESTPQVEALIIQLVINTPL